tara:strand:+ start:7480 stop:7989 length:510 start_codon:yes stop_codon:yes gene_type:complete
MKIVLLALLLFSSSVFAAWTSVIKKDDFTDETVRYALYSDDSHSIQISHQDSSVWMFISRKKIGSFEPNTLLELRVDQNKTMEVDPENSKILERIGKKSYQWEPGTVGFLIWHGKEDEGCGFISQLVSGRELKVRYQVNSLERESFSVNLEGAKQAIVDGLSLKVCGSN